MSRVVNSREKFYNNSNLSGKIPTVLKSSCIMLVFSPGATQPIVGVYFTALCRALASSRARLLDHTQRRATLGRTPLNE